MLKREILDREIAIAEHRKMWLWIAIQTLKQKRCVEKREYFISLLKENGERCIVPTAYCYCCEYGEQELTRISNLGIVIRSLDERCKFCPVDWGGDKEELQCIDKKSKGDGIFEEWGKLRYIGEYKRAALVAYKISKLPERKD